MGLRVSSWSFFALYAVLVFYFSLQFVPEFFGVRASTVSGNDTDKVALLEFKSMIADDPLGVLGSWNESINFCEWHGVTCSHRHQRVTILDLQSLKLAGSISPYIGNLSFLKELHLQNNSFTHEIPTEIGRLRRLEVFLLHNNSIGGEIPSNMSSCSNLILINLAYNQLVGKIPSEFGSLSKVELLSARNNNLTGSIPSSFGNLSSLNFLSLPFNNLAGNIPETFGRLKNLVELTIGVNMLSGAIPSSIFNISSITVFDVGFNYQIQGTIPLDFGITLSNLQVFSISQNQITGAIPHSISNATNLEVFQTSFNKLTGEVPSLEKLQKLFRISIRSNNLGSGERDDLNFLCSLTNATSLDILNIGINSFGGLLPECTGNLSTTLKLLHLDSNKIFGSIPTGIGKFVNLRRLLLWENQFSGIIPPAIGELQNLGELYLGRNRFIGNIPSSIGNLKKLTQLDLSNNFLQGTIPSSLGQCESLVRIDLSYNNLSGTIPFQLIGLSSLSIALDLSRNQLTGSLPTEVGNLKNLGLLNVSGNLLSGDIPSTLGSCTSMEKLDMHNNLFQGHIPSSLSSLRGLRYLDLSQNNLSGKIPVFLAGFQLENLNLSYNDLEGMIPTTGVFKNTSATSVLGNSKLCGGMPEFWLQTCDPHKSKQRRLSTVALKTIAIVSGLVGLALALSSLFLCWVMKRKEKPDPSNSINPLLNLSYQNLYNATNGFSSANLMGAGSFGSVYKGILDEGRTTVAVKVFNLLHRGASKSFIAECGALRNIRHRNLIKIITVCSGVDYRGNDFKALVYDFMPNGSLEEWLHPVTGEDKASETPKNLNLFQRLNVAIDVACALNYLHHDCLPPTAHCDLKPSNVLLDDEMTAHLGDFGLARFIPPDHKHTSSIGVKGSIGYIAPEYGLGSEVSTNGDIYSYGILLLEMVTSKKPTDNMFEGELNLHNFARMALPDNVMDVVDTTLLNDDDVELAAATNQRQRQGRIDSGIECLISILRIGVACSMESPQDRMNISNVVQELQSIKNNMLDININSNFIVTA